MFERVSLNLCVCIFVSSLLGGCVTIPQSEFRSYLDAFDEFKSASEQSLLDLDSAQQIVESISKKDKKNKGPQIYATPAKINLLSQSFSQKDQVVIRREALDTVIQYNSILVDLAAGRKPSEIKSGVQSLVSGLEGITSLLDKAPLVSGSSVGLISTIVENLDKAQNRKQFILALQKGAPVIDAILVVFTKDAEKTYGIYFSSLQKLARKEQLDITNKYSQMIKVSKEHKVPNSEIQKELDSLNKELSKALPSVGIPFSVNLSVDPASRKEFDAIVLSQLQQTFSQIKKSILSYKEIKLKQVNRYELALSYGQLIRQARITLGHVVKSLNNPETINRNSMELLSVAFDVKRKWHNVKNPK